MNKRLAKLVLCWSLVSVTQCNNNLDSKIDMLVFPNKTEEIVKKTRDNVLFTIDDGPTQYMLDIANTLDSLDYKWIFFIVTRGVKESTKKNIIEVIKMGHDIWNHSYDHPNFKNLNIEQAKEQILVSDSIIGSLYEEAGVKRDKKQIRYPYGNEPSKHYKEEFNNFLDSLWYEKHMFWHMDVDLLDWRQKPAKQKIDMMKDWDTILLHERFWTTETINDIVKSIDAKKIVL